MVERSAEPDEALMPEILIDSLKWVVFPVVSLLTLAALSAGGGGGPGSGRFDR